MSVPEGNCPLYYASFHKAEKYAPREASNSALNKRDTAFFNSEPHDLMAFPEGRMGERRSGAYHA
jgi:hypothetical protein